MGSWRGEICRDPINNWRRWWKKDEMEEGREGVVVDDAKVSEYRMKSPARRGEEYTPEATEFSMVGLDRWKG